MKKIPKTKKEIRAYQKKLNDAGYHLEVDGIWGKNTEQMHKEYVIDTPQDFSEEFLKDFYKIVPTSNETIQGYKDRAAIKDSEGTGLAKGVRNIALKSGILDVSKSQYLHDLLGGKSIITGNDLDYEEMEALRGIVRTNLSEGRTNITYDDYFENANNVSNNAQGRIQTTLGSADILVNGNDTLVVDTYDFNDAPQDRGSMSLLDRLTTSGTEIYNESGAYNRARKLGKWFGSSPHEGGGSDSIINIRQEELPDPRIINNQVPRESTSINTTYKNGGMRLSSKLYEMQMGGYNPFSQLSNIPLSTGLGYAQGIGLGKGLGFNEKSQKDLGRLSALNNGLNSTAGLINSVSRRKEERERLQTKKNNDYYAVPQDRYRYADYSSAPRQGSFFQNGGEKVPEIRDAKMEALDSYLEQLERKKGNGQRPFIPKNLPTYDITRQVKPTLSDFGVLDKPQALLMKGLTGQYQDPANYLKARGYNEFAQGLGNVLIDPFIGVPFSAAKKTRDIAKLSNAAYKALKPLRGSHSKQALKALDKVIKDKTTAAGVGSAFLLPKVDAVQDFISPFEYQNGGQVPVSNNGLYDYPNQPVIVPSNNITMDGINHDVLAIPDNDQPVMMKPNKQYTFKNSQRILEIPQL